MARPRTIKNRINVIFSLELEEYDELRKRIGQNSISNEIRALIKKFNNDQKEAEKPKIELTPLEMIEIHEQLKHGGLVDYVMKLPYSDLKIIYDIINDEYQLRQKRNTKCQQRM